MSEIVVGVDGSAASRMALLWSLEQGVWTGGQVTAVHVWHVPLALEVPFDTLTTSSLCDDLSRGVISGFPQTRVAALHGDPGPVLVERAREADLLVVGARHHSAFHDFRGSVSSHCLNHSRTPVAVVPSDMPTQSSHRPRRVAVGVDLTPDSAAALRWASHQARIRAAELIVAHAWHVSPGSLTDLTHPANTRRAQQTRATLGLRDWVREVLGQTQQTPVHLHVERGGPLDTLVTRAADADLLVLGSHGHHALARLLVGSMSGQLARLSTCPVVVVAAAGSLTGSAT